MSYTVDGLINGGLISEWAYRYIRSNVFVGKWMGLYPGGGLKLGGALKVDFTVGISTGHLQ